MLLRVCVIAAAFFSVVMAADHDVAAQGDLSSQSDAGINALKALASLRASLIRILEAIGPAAAPVIPSLVETLKDKGENSEVRAEAARALAKIGPAAAIPALVEVLKDKGADPPVKMIAARALGAIGPAAAPAIPALNAALKDSDPADRAVIAAALKAIGPAPNIPE